MTTLSKIKELEYKSKIIVSLREPFSLLTSMFKYRIKHGKHFKNFDDWFFRDEAQDLFSLLHFDTLYKSLLTFFDEQDIYFLFYEDLDANHTMIHDFYQILGLDINQNFIDLRVNKSLSNKQVQLSNKFNKLTLNKRIKKLLLKIIPVNVIKDDESFFYAKYKNDVANAIGIELHNFSEKVPLHIQDKLRKHKYCNK